MMAGGPDRAGERRIGRFLMQVLWPSFLTAIVACGGFFSMIDPHELVLAGITLASSREGAYTLSFFVFWILFALSSSLTWLLSNGIDSPQRRPDKASANPGLRSIRSDRR
jgi:hypothetical protein